MSLIVISGHSSSFNAKKITRDRVR